MVDTVNKIKTSLIDNLEKEISFELNANAIPEIKEIILRNYQELSLYRMHRDSVLGLDNFYNNLQRLLDEFLYLEIKGSKIKLKVPDIVTINESSINELKVLLVIMEGLAGSYLEMTQEEVARLNIPVLNSIEFTVNLKKVYLVKRTAEIESALAFAGMPIKPWPFSKSEDVFAGTDKLINENIDRWIKSSIKKARSKLIQEYK